VGERRGGRDGWDTGEKKGGVEDTRAEEEVCVGVVG